MIDLLLYNRNHRFLRFASLDWPVRTPPSRIEGFGLIYMRLHDEPTVGRWVYREEA